MLRQLKLVQAAIGGLVALCALAIPLQCAAEGITSQILRPPALIRDGAPQGTHLQLAQSSDATFRVNQLEDQLRKLTGQIEELNFQLLQMQEQIRKMQSDNEYRFQELEDGKQGSVITPDADTSSDVADNRVKKEFRVEKLQPSDLGEPDNGSDGSIDVVRSQQQPRMIDGVEIYDGSSGVAQEPNGTLPLGTITFDSLGNVIDTAVGKPVDLTASLRGAGNESETGDDNSFDLASVQSPRELYELGYEYFQAGDYHHAKLTFENFAERFPDDRKIAKANFWLGESLFSQSNFEASAKVFLDTHTNWPDAKIAPQALLKLGVSLAGMNQRELACATYVKVYKKYPDIGNAMRNRVEAEQKSARCLGG